jgi:hypothetical protein
LHVSGDVSRFPGPDHFAAPNEMLARLGSSGTPPHPQGTEQKRAEEHDNADEQQKQEALDDDTHEAEHDRNDYEK